MKRKTTTKKDFPVKDARCILEPGPIVLVSSLWKGETNIMTMGWHTVMEFAPALFGCIIAESNHSFDIIRKSRECVINVPDAAMAKQVVGIGNCSGERTDKFEKFKLTPEKSARVKPPLIKECFANFECRLHDDQLIDKYNFFIFKILKAHAATSPKYPKTMHYHGKGIFTLSGKVMDLHRKFKKQNL